MIDFLSDAPTAATFDGVSDAWLTVFQNPGLLSLILLFGYDSGVFGMLQVNQLLSDSGS